MRRPTETQLTAIMIRQATAIVRAAGATSVCRAAATLAAPRQTSTYASHGHSQRRGDGSGPAVGGTTGPGSAELTSYAGRSSGTWPGTAPALATHQAASTSAVPARAPTPPATSCARELVRQEDQAQALSHPFHREERRYCGHRVGQRGDVDEDADRLQREHGQVEHRRGAAGQAGQRAGRDAEQGAGHHRQRQDPAEGEPAPASVGSSRPNSPSARPRAWRDLGDRGHPRPGQSSVRRGRRA